MTRCYEYYCLFECKPDKCTLVEKGPKGKKKHRSGISRIRKYVKFMKEKKVQFDKTDDDKELFYDLVDEYGTEGIVTQNVANLQHEKSAAEPREDVILSDIKDITLNDVDLILTDPPYLREYLPLWAMLFEKALQGLKESGLLVIYSPHIHLPAIFSLVPKGLNYVWIMAQIHKGAKTENHFAKVNIGWKPILIFVKGKMPDIAYYADVLQGYGREKDDHEWQQALGESEALIKIFSHEGALVVDPFVGSGTTAVAARNTGRSFMVFDNDPNAIKTTLRRLEVEI